MTTIEREITDKTKVSDLTVGDLKNIIRAVLEETLADPDEGKKLNPEFEESLKAYLEQPEALRKRGKTLDEISDELGLND